MRDFNCATEQLFTHLCYLKMGKKNKNVGRLHWNPWFVGFPLPRPLSSFTDSNQRRIAPIDFRYDLCYESTKMTDSACLKPCVGFFNKSEWIMGKADLDHVFVPWLVPSHPLSSANPERDLSVKYPLNFLYKAKRADYLGWLGCIALSAVCLPSEGGTRL